jgi:hypothetical protein
MMENVNRSLGGSPLPPPRSERHRLNSIVALTDKRQLLIVTGPVRTHFHAFEVKY